MGHAQVSHNDHQVYLLTIDTPLMMAAYRAVGLEFSPATIHPIVARLIDRTRKYLPQADVQVWSFDEIRQGVHRLLNEALKTYPDAIIATTNRLLCPHTNCISRDYFCCIEINRLISLDSQALGLGPRPWHPSLEHQVKRLAQHCGKRPLIVLEDGSWSGKTLTEIIGMCRRYGINVAQIICGILFDRGYDYIQANAWDCEIPHVLFQQNCLDWMPDHDFFPFVPNCGRVIGHQQNGCWMPIGEQGFSFSRPYILPYGDPVGWASIPVQHALSFSTECLQDTIALFQELETTNATEVPIGVITNLYPRTSFPVYNGGYAGIPSPDTRIVKVLERDYNKLMREAEKC